MYVLATLFTHLNTTYSTPQRSVQLYIIEDESNRTSLRVVSSFEMSKMVKALLLSSALLKFVSSVTIHAFSVVMPTKHTYTHNQCPVQHMPMPMN